MRPSDYFRRQIWLTTQPMEEPIHREHVLDTIEWLGWDRLLFATDYPHWDYDDPAQVLPMPVDETKRRDFFLNNAVRLYRQG
jgi:predicted TIM-barrel fold metal-dependent hydrolase